jgi:hypothetical protein
VWFTKQLQGRHYTAVKLRATLVVGTYDCYDALPLITYHYHITHCIHCVLHACRVEVTFQRKDRESGVEESITKQKSRGFGFVQFLCSRDAAKVVREHGVVQVKKCHLYIPSLLNWYILLVRTLYRVLYAVMVRVLL